MTSFVLPLPNNIYVAATSVGNELLINDTRITLSNSETISLKTNNRLGLYIDRNQNIGVNTNILDHQFNINNNNGNLLRLQYNNLNPTDLNLDSSGNFYINSSGVNTIINNNFNIINHNGFDHGLKLAGVLINSTANQLNFNNVLPGIAQANKTLVLDNSKNIIGINSITTNELTGTLITTFQPNINSLNTLNIINHDGGTVGLQLGGSLVVCTADQINYNDVTPGIAQPNKSLVLDISNNIININNIITNTLYGTLTLPSQPNITSLGYLNQLNIFGDVGIGTNLPNMKLEINEYTGQCLQLSYNAIGGVTSLYSTLTIIDDGSLNIFSSSNTTLIDATNSFNIDGHNGSNKGLKLNNILVTATANQLNFNNVIAGAAQSNKSLVLDNFKSITGITSLVSTSLTGILTTGSQPNITSINTLNINNSLSLLGTLITSSALQINYNNVTAGTAQANKSLVLDGSKNITGITLLSSTNLSGTIITSNQPNISLVNNLTIAQHDGATLGLTLGSTLVIATANQLNFNTVTSGIAQPNKSLVLDINSNIVGINSLSSNTLTGLITTNFQPNINSVNILNIINHDGLTQGLSLNGTLITVSANKINTLNTTPGTAQISKALIVDSSKNIAGINTLTANYIFGLIETTSQPLINLVNTLNINNHDGLTQGLSLNNVLITSTANQLNYNTVTPGMANSLKSLVVDTFRNIGNINSLIATTLTGILLTTNQPNINTVNILNILQHDGLTQGLALNNILITATADQINTVNMTYGNAAANKALILDNSRNIININSLSALFLSGTLQTANQPNINLVNTLNINSHNGLTQGLSLNNVLVTATANQLNYNNTTTGIGVASKALILDSSKNIININLLSANLLTGTLQTAIQPNITTVNTLTITNHNGIDQGLTLGSTLVTVNANQLNYLKTNPGFTSASTALVVDNSLNITGINTLQANTINANNVTIGGLVSNFNTGSLVAKVYSGLNTVGRIVYSTLLSNLSLTNFAPNGIAHDFSMELIGYIYPQFSETYVFSINCNDRVRLWVNNKLLLSSWSYVTGTRVSSSINLSANTYYSFYLQFEVDSDIGELIIQWQSLSTPLSVISFNNLAWDSNQPNHFVNPSFRDNLTLYNSSTSGITSGTISVDVNGDINIDASGNDVIFSTTDNVNISSHNGNNAGLYLAGQLVTLTATQLNVLRVSNGIASPSHALVLDGNSNISGISSLTSTTLACTNLSASNFSINSLSLTGAFSNFNVGGLLIKEITGPDLSGRIVNTAITTVLNLNNYDPATLNNNFSLEISGYIFPQYTENYTFYIIVNDRARIWVNGVLLLNIWNIGSGIEYTSPTIQLVANRWTSIYIQYQDISNTPLLQVRWSSPSVSKNYIVSSLMAWDNRDLSILQQTSVANSLTIYNTVNSTNIISSTLYNDNVGYLHLTSTGNNVLIDSGNNFNILGHNGTNIGLMLNSILVTANATQLNYLTGTSPGIVIPNKAIILDNTNSISGLSSISATNITGTLITGYQPNIFGLGTITNPLLINTSSQIGGLGSLDTNGRFQFITNNGICYLQTGTSNATNSSADLLISNMNTTINNSNKLIMIKGNGNIGIQTSVPNKILSINGQGSIYSTRLIYSNNLGTETIYTDLGTDSSGNLLISPTGPTCNIMSNLYLGSSAQSTFTINSGTLKITSTSGIIQLGSTTNNTFPLELGSVSYNMSTSRGYINQYGSSGVASNNITSNYSLRTEGSIICGGEVNIVSDVRVKKNIKNIDNNYCKEFINKTNPVTYELKTEIGKVHHGYIAQELIKTGFADLVSIIPDLNIKELIDNDGFTSPANEKYVVCYDKIIPILATCITDLYKENNELKNKINNIFDLLNKK